MRNSESSGVSKLSLYGAAKDCVVFKIYIAYIMSYLIESMTHSTTQKKTKNVHSFL